MIKRLKWNVLYGGGGGEESDFSDASSEDSVGLGSKDASLALRDLARNDIELSELLAHHAKSVSASGEDNDSLLDEDDSDSQLKILTDTSDGDADVGVDSGAEGPYAEWRECELCPAKRLLNDEDVDKHIASKSHRKAVLRAEKKALETRCESASEVNPVTEDNEKSEKSSEGSDVGGAPATDEGNVKKNEDTDIGLNVLGSTNMVGGDGAPQKDHPAEKPNDDAIEAERKRREKKKIAAKRKLKSMKRRKWEKQKVAREKKLSGKEGGEEVLSAVPQDADCPNPKTAVKLDREARGKNPSVESPSITGSAETKVKSKKGRKRKFLEQEKGPSGALSSGTAFRNGKKPVRAAKSAADDLSDITRTESPKPKNRKKSKHGKSRPSISIVEKGEGEFSKPSKPKKRKKGAKPTTVPAIPS